MFSVLGFWTAIAAVLAVMLSDFFDTMGTVVGLGDEAGLLDQRGPAARGSSGYCWCDSLAAAARRRRVGLVEHHLHRVARGRR